MLFNSYTFLVFFPVVTIIYFLLPHKIRWLWLLAASCYFYMWFVPIYIFILFGTIIIDYIAGLLIVKQTGAKRKALLIMSLVANIGILAVFKYYNFFLENINSVLGTTHLPYLSILLPIGLSFHTFQAMSYTIEVYRGNQKPESHFGIYALYVMFYPQLVAGPIERPQNMLHQFHEKKYLDVDNISIGLRLILWGMIKKVVIADRLNSFTAPVFNNVHDSAGITIFIAIIFFSFQIFCDFSGYSDIALGTARVMGFKLMTNFNKPYHSRSIAEFWKRWHISLSTWFKDYLYIPLGGNRMSVPRNYLNLFIVFLVSGFWHGANWTFIIWGALHGFYLVFGQMTQQVRKSITDKIGLSKIRSLNNMINVFFVFSLVTITWIFFRANTVGDAFFIFNKLRDIPVELKQILKEKNLIMINMPRNGTFVFQSFLLIGCLEIIHIIDAKYHVAHEFQLKPAMFRWTVYVLGISAIIFLGTFSANSFIYFQF